jgi:hypothetical protein
MLNLIIATRCNRAAAKVPAKIQEQMQNLVEGKKTQQ